MKRIKILESQLRMIKEKKIPPSGATLSMKVSTMRNLKDVIRFK